MSYFPSEPAGPPRLSNHEETASSRAPCVPHALFVFVFHHVWAWLALSDVGTPKMRFDSWRSMVSQIWERIWKPSLDVGATPGQPAAVTAFAVATSKYRMCQRKSSSFPAGAA